VVHLEDESGRVTLVGSRLRKEVERPGGGLVTGKFHIVDPLTVSPRLNVFLRNNPGVVTACLGMENASGDFEVIDICFGGLPPLAAPSSLKVVKPLQTDTKQNVNKGKGKAKRIEPDEDVDMEGSGDVKVDDGEKEPLWVALVSGLSAGSSEVPEDLKGQLLSEWLMGELGDVDVSNRSQS
jgi:DNA polymerase delta subunit 2